MMALLNESPIPSPILNNFTKKAFSMKTRVKWIEDLCLFAESGSGHGMILDGAPEVGGRNAGTRPMELLLIGLGGCTAMDVVTILRKQRQAVTDCVIEIEGERALDPPKIYTKIHVHYIVTGKNLNEKHVKRAIDLSVEGYCSVQAMLEKSATITHDYEIVEVAELG